jgi:GAF domain-containing protein
MPEQLSEVRELLESYAQVNTTLLQANNTRAVLQLLTEQAVSRVPGAEHSGVSELRKGRFETPAASSDLPRQVDAIQYSLGHGPCVDAVLDQTVYRSDNIAEDERWSDFGLRAQQETGITSMLSFRLFLEEDDSRSGLNFYSSKEAAFDDEDVRVGTMLATHAALAFAAAQRLDTLLHLEVALASNRNIGIAIGIIMASELVTDEQAFDLLRIKSQSTHRKLRDVASDVTRTGTIDF